MTTNDDERLKCSECEAMILPRTAADNSGLCAGCVQLSPEFSAEIRDFKYQVSSGKIYAPPVSEFASSLTPIFFMQSSTVWIPGADYYSDTDINSVESALSEAYIMDSGNVFLTAGEGIWLTLAFNRTYGVCYYENISDLDFRYAYTLSNARQQVDSTLQLDQGDTSCGVGMHWFPSRYHMTRVDAFDIVQSVIERRLIDDVNWLVSGDFTRTGQGYG